MKKIHTEDAYQPINKKEKKIVNVITIFFLG